MRLRKAFTMTQEQLDKLLDACAPVPMIALHCGRQVSQQERANAAWRKLGEEMEFDYMSVKPNGEDQKCFTAYAKGDYDY